MSKIRVGIRSDFIQWIGSIYVPYPKRLAIVFLALFIDLTFASLIVLKHHLLASNQPNQRSTVASWFEFYPATNIEHRVERTNAFVSLIFGYSVVGVMFQKYEGGASAFLGKAVLGLCQAYFFNWLYFDVDGTNLHLHAIRRKSATAFLWHYAHIPFILSYVLASAALSKLVVATDCPDTNSHNLSHHYEERSSDTIATGIRYFYCHGLAIALLSMAVISVSHKHKAHRGMRLRKKWRVANRVLVCVVMFLLPVAGDGLNSLELVGITTALTTWVLVLENWGMSCAGGEECGVRYLTRCSKRELEAAEEGLRGREREREEDVGVEVKTLDRTEKTMVAGS